ncbi:HesB/IscA family protein [Domibacillus epiphyticus]|uniref:Core domain-containing protein n=1 Tax=Domibacillus epiphyticus TaxID=1714355 RepID=A0A1V2A419_9BACI|nr:iron-sulfur cluster assembly accessory protein [Domibacillus epiphyticus]OMP65749.1 hypothetical protein BTO28_15910 [Domibacillus epiphyticus]
MFTITDKAQEKIREMITKAGGESFLRYGIKSECCSELKYELSISANKNDQDIAIDFDGFSVLINPADTHLIKNTDIDFKDDQFEYGFIIHNQNPLVSF